MALRFRRASVKDDDEGGFSATVRLARPGQSHIKSIRPGDIAVIDIVDLERADAEVLIDAKARAVVNAATSSSGRFPNLGPKLLAEAGITLIDDVGSSILAKLKSGDVVRIEGNRILKDGILVGEGVTQDDATLTRFLDAAERDLSTRLGSLTANASHHLERERAMLLEGERIPRLKMAHRNRPVVIVQRTHDWECDLKSLKKWIRDHDAVVLGVGAGADAALELGLDVDIVVGEPDDISDRALRCGADILLVSRGSGDGDARFERAAASVTKFVGSGSAGDLAIVLADHNEAPIIVEVGAAPDLVTFLDRGPAEVASTFVARLRAGRRLVDAKAVAHLVARPLSAWPIVVLFVAALIALGVAVATTGVGQQWGDNISETVNDALSWIKDLLP